jgi:hypothetical protein
MTPTDRKKIRAITADMQRAASKRAQILEALQDGPARMDELCAAVRACGPKQRLTVKSSLRQMRVAGSVVSGHMKIAGGRAIRVSPLRVWALPEHVGVVEVVA